MRKIIDNKICYILKIAIIIFMTGFITHKAHALIEIDITSGNIRPIPIGTPYFETKTRVEKKYANLILQVINNDMESSGLFRIVNNKSYLDNSSFSAKPKFRDWRLIKVEALIKGKISLNGSRMTTQFVLWDIAAKKNVVSIQYTSKNTNWRKIAHIIADAVYERLTSEKGYFDSKIVFIDETGPKNNRIKKLAIMDQDGNNVVYLTQGESLVLTPRFSPKKEEITYVSYQGGAPRVYMYNLKNGRQEVVGDFPDMTFSPRFTPDGNRVVMSLERKGHSNIYIRDLRTGRTERLTRTAAIDIAPSFSPDGKYITFESDRGGTQQIYVMSANGKDQRRISYGKGRYSTPVWSPRGDYISFTKLVKGIFLIGIIRPDGSGERILTRGYHNEGPTWAPNGRVIAFFRETRGVRGGPKIFTIDITGQNERILPTPNFSSDPSWSPLSK